MSSPLPTPPSASASRDPGLLVPVPPPPGAAPRVVGPGRLERALRGRLSELERELATARLVERGAQRRQDRIEREVEDARHALEEAARRERRLILALGLLQGENAELRRSVHALEARTASRRALPTPRRGWLARLLRRA